MCMIWLSSWRDEKKFTWKSFPFPFSVLGQRLRSVSEQSDWMKLITWPRFLRVLSKWWKWKNVCYLHGKLLFLACKSFHIKRTKDLRYDVKYVVHFSSVLLIRRHGKSPLKEWTQILSSEIFWMYILKSGKIENTQCKHITTYCVQYLFEVRENQQKQNRCQA